jgi:UDP-glucose 4-epimerase
MKIAICGGAGFIGSNLAERLAKNPRNEIVIIDNFRTGKREFVKELLKQKNVSLIECDLLDAKKTISALKGADIVYNLAANADVRGGINDTRIDFDLNFETNYNVLEALRVNGIKKYVFTSTSQVYGEAKLLPTPENYEPKIPTSLYGASKLAAEAYTCVYSNYFAIQSYIFRFVNAVGKNGTHGVIWDFAEKLRKNPREIEILGDGKQQKAFMHIDDCIDAVEFAVANADERINIFNIGTDDFVNVKQIADIVCEELKIKGVKYKFLGGERGWVGDVPKVILSIAKIKKLGWKPKMNSAQAIRKAMQEDI